MKPFLFLLFLVLGGLVLLFFFYSDFNDVLLLAFSHLGTKLFSDVARLGLVIFDVLNSHFKWKV